MVDLDRLERLQKKLYEPGARFEVRRSPLNQRSGVSSGGWVPPDRTTPAPAPRPRQPRWLSLLFIIAIVVFVGSVAVAGYLILWRGNIVSSANLEVLIEGPAAVIAGDEATFQLSVTNKNDVAVQTADLIITYPEGTRAADDLTKELSRTRELLGAIAPGTTVNKTIHAVFLGDPSIKKELVVTIEYHLEDSVALFDKETRYAVAITSTPIDLVLTAPPTVNADQPAVLSLLIVSNAKSTLEHLLLSLVYPSGFEFIGATPAPTLNTNVWTIGSLAPGEKRELSLQGYVHGQADEEKPFRAVIGTESSLEEGKVAVPYNSTLATVTLKQPFITIGVTLNEKSDPVVVVKPGDLVKMEITWKNNLSVPVANAALALSIGGPSLDEVSVQPEGGVYRASDDRIRWDRTTTPSLASVQPGATGVVRVTFKTKSLDPGAGELIQNPRIDFRLDFSGTRVTEGLGSETVTASAARVAKVETGALLTSVLSRAGSPFPQTGPIPPRVDQPSTYTIQWSVGGVTNPVHGARLVTTLSPHTTWLGRVSATGETLRYDESTKTLTWDLGEIRGGTGITLPARQAVFQVSLTPGLDQLSSEPILLGTATLTGIDSYTNSSLVRTLSPMTTRLDPRDGFELGNGRVTQ